MSTQPSESRKRPRRRKTPIEPIHVQELLSGAGMSGFLGILDAPVPMPATDRGIYSVDMTPQLIRIGNHILNLANVQYMVVETSNLVNVYFTSGVEIRYSAEEAEALLAALDAGHVAQIEAGMSSSIESAHRAGAPRSAKVQAARSAD